MLLLCVLLLLLGWSECGPVPQELMQVIDMTHTFDESTLYFPTLRKFEINVTQKGYTKEGYWLQLEEYSSATHVGTHFDAPCHVAPGKWSVDQIPVERLLAPAAVVDITDKAFRDPDAVVEINDLLEWEHIAGKSLDKTIVVMRSGWGRRWNNREAYIGTSGNDTDNMHFPGMSVEAARWLVFNRNVYGFASDSVALDNGKSRNIPVTQILLNANIYGIQSVANVEEIPIVGACLHVLPMKIGKACGAPVRIIASFPKLIYKPKVW